MIWAANPIMLSWENYLSPQDCHGKCCNCDNWQRTKDSFPFREIHKRVRPLLILRFDNGAIRLATFLASQESIQVTSECLAICFQLMIDLCSVYKIQKITC